ncbi:MAG TPA: hypothetical protein VJN96_05095 [Vicinamibacterales bacterium]|nr:hypothetical protein [Vicinamibacterales bacterium]
MIRLLVVFLVLLATGCSAAPHKSAAEKPAQPGALRQPDDLCMNDCLGNGGDRQFCEHRCTD